ncbi:MAG: glycosyltransferase family 4 protein, partial [archaeon]
MRVLHLTSEYPPHKVGGLGTHVEELTRAQVKAGIEPIVVVCAFSGNQGYENVGGVHVFRFDADNIPAEDFPSWALQMNVLMQNKASEVIEEFKDISLIHAHDWLVATAAVGIKHIFRIPLISTVHSLEKGRRGGIYEDRQELINDLERKMVYESWRVITCSHFMKQCVCSSFSTPWDKIDVIPNGVDMSRYDFDYARYQEAKGRFALPHEKIVFFVGRHVWEKGLDVLIGAARSVIAEVPDVKFVVTGEGYMTDKCKDMAHQMGLGDKVMFTGYTDEETLNGLFHVSDVIAVPSRYEPFGIVALEGMASRTPVVAADTGGLSEIIQHDINGLKVWAGHSESLAVGIKRILKDPKLKESIVSNAYDTVKNTYSWGAIANMTKATYERIAGEYQKASWKPSP